MSTDKIHRVLTTTSLTLNASRIAHVMRLGKAQLERDAKSFIDEAARFEAIATKAQNPDNADQARRAAENMRGMARQFQQYIDEASDIILTIEAATEMAGGQVAIVMLSSDEISDVIRTVNEMKDEA